VEVKSEINKRETTLDAVSFSNFYKEINASPSPTSVQAVIYVDYYLTFTLPEPKMVYV
jgi:hypothetical protein